MNGGVIADSSEKAQARVVPREGGESRWFCGITEVSLPASAALN